MSRWLCLRALVLACGLLATAAFALDDGVSEELAPVAADAVLLERVIAKAKVKQIDGDHGRTFVEVNSFVNNEIVFTGDFEMFRSKSDKGGSEHETGN